jgi:nucleotide-binding universal stress UspA family protein
MFQSILVPLDGSAFGEQALPLALSIARRADASLEVAHVHETLAPVYSQPVSGMEGLFVKEIRAQRAAYLSGVVKRLASQTKVPIEPAFLEGAIVPAIVDRVSARHSDLIVMTTHGHGALARFWLGSVADQLVRQSPVPILLVRLQEEKPDFSKEPAIRKILIALDGSALSESILDQAVPVAHSLHAEVLLLRVIQPAVLGQVAIPDPAAGVGSISPSFLEKLATWHKERLKEATSYLEKIASSLRTSSLTVRASVISHEHPAVAILNEARSQGADIIAIETHGRSGLSRFFLGSIADKVIRGSSVPVLVHHPSNELVSQDGHKKSDG